MGEEARTLSTQFEVGIINVADMILLLKEIHVSNELSCNIFLIELTTDELEK